LQFNLTGCTLVLAIPSALSATSPLVKLLEASPKALSVRFYADTAQGLGQYIQTTLSATGVSIAPDALRLLTNGLGADREVAARELEKLLLYIAPAKNITAADVQASLSGAPKVDSFVVAEAVANRNPEQTDKLIQLLLAEGDTLESAFHAVSRHLGQLAQAQTLLNEGTDMATVMAKFGKLKAPKDAQEAFTRQLGSYPPARLKTLAAYTYKTLADARRHGSTAPLTLARAMLALSV
jgi:DNA polymerase III subunit delta